MKYKANKESQQAGVIGLLYVVIVRLFDKKTGESVTHKLLLVGCEESDIERKLKWLFDATRYGDMKIKSCEKVRDKVHYLSSHFEQEAPARGSIERNEGSPSIPGAPLTIEEPMADAPLCLYAVGIATTMTGRDESHALRKIASALINRANPGARTRGLTLSDDSVITVSQIPFSSGFAKPRDVSQEVNRAQIVRG